MVFAPQAAFRRYSKKTRLEYSLGEIDAFGGVTGADWSGCSVLKLASVPPNKVCRAAATPEKPTIEFIDSPGNCRLVEIVLFAPY